MNKINIPSFLDKNRNKKENKKIEEIIIERVSGSKIIDAKGNEYVDMSNSNGTFILGHSHPNVIEAIHKTVTDGLSKIKYYKIETEFKEIIFSSFYEYDDIKIINSMNEAGIIAEKIAKKFTKREIILRFEDNFNKKYDSSTIVTEINNEQKVDEIFKKNENKIAAIIVEPLITKYGLFEQKKEFIKYLREISWKNGTLLIFDEINTGFRFKFGGYYQLIKVIPDMIILGKVIGGGLPLGVIIGLERLLNSKEINWNNYEAGILSGNAIALTAGIATMKIISNNDIYEKIEKFGGKIADEINKYKSTNIKCRQIGSIIWPFFGSEKIPKKPIKITEISVKKYNEIYHNIMKKGYYLSPSPYDPMFLSSAHDEKEINKFVLLLNEEIKEMEKNHKEEARDAQIY